MQESIDTDSIGGNPHAEDPANFPRIDWRTDPAGWVAAYATLPAFGWDGKEEAITRAHVELSAVVDGFASNVAIRRELLPLVTLLAAISAALPYTVGDSRFVRFGPILVPTSPRGLDVLRMVRTLARESFQLATLDIVESDSTLGELLAALHATREESDSGMLEMFHNATVPESSAFRMSLDFHSRAIANMPKGSDLPGAILAPKLVGFEIDDIQEIQSEISACTEGLAQFLLEFGIDFEQSGGSYECDSCGGESESDEGGEIESADTFQLTAEMVEAIDTQGFGDKLREYVGAVDDTEGWTGFLALSDAEILERSGPVEGKGIVYDPEVWSFDPDYDSLEDLDGFDNMETSDVLRVGSTLARIVAAHAEVGTLPPIPGTLAYRPMDHERTMLQSARASIAFAWEPDTGRLQTALGGMLALRWDTLRETATLVLRARDSATAPWQDRTVSLDPKGSSWIASAPHDSGGALASILVRVQASQAEV